MKFYVAGVCLNLVVDPYDIILPEGDQGTDIEAYLDNRFWQTGNCDEEIILQIFPVEKLPSVGGQTIWESDTCTVRKAGEAEIRIYHDGVVKQPYAIYGDSRKGDIRVWCEINWLRRNCHLNYLFNICALEKQLIQNKKVVFHSCYIQYRGKALLFSGFSGVGKSTQGALWEKYADAMVVNGDRSVLGKQDDHWYAFGFPFSGTSGICYNVALPLCAIVFLKQAEENRIRRVDAAEAGQLLWPQMTVNQWDPGFVDEVLEQINQIAAEVQIYELCCTPDERAVICVNDMLQL